MDFVLIVSGSLPKTGHTVSLSTHITLRKKMTVIETNWLKMPVIGLSNPFFSKDSRWEIFHN